MFGVDPEVFKDALSKVNDGNLFEQFALNYLSAALSYDFVPVGGLKDRAIDGLEHTFHRKGRETHVFQITIEKNSEGKLAKTIAALIKSHVKFDQLCFVTNQRFPNKDKTIDDFYDSYTKPLQIRDIDWLASHVNDSPHTVRLYQAFIASYLHEFNRPGASYVISDLAGDPRLFVFLRQQWDENRQSLNLDEILADTLIQYALEGTDPDKNLFKSADEIKTTIAALVNFELRQLSDTIDRRLVALTRRPRQIQYHSKANAYCLPYETRTAILERNLKDTLLHQRFLSGVESRLSVHLRDASVRVQDCVKLIETTFNQIFYQQGLEFADFVLHAEDSEAVEKNLPDTIAQVVDSSSVVVKNRAQVKTALLATIRDVVYTGTPDEHEFLRRLSYTYMMLFLLQCDPKIATFFHSMASKLDVYVCTSIIVPALSEYYLSPENRRHWNLLKGASAAGVGLIVNETILDELAAHFRLIVEKYDEQFRPEEDFYLADEDHIQYVDEILIRAYLYAKTRGRVSSFRDFIDNFVTPGGSNCRDELLEWLKAEFGIRFRANSSLGITIDSRELNVLFEELKNQKRSEHQARSDAKLVLTIHAIRLKNNETEAGGMLGYRTWWLSKDTTTQDAVDAVLGYKYHVGVYMRPDFLCNYIALAPTNTQVTGAYQQIFPTMLGINVSTNLPKEVSALIHHEIRQHRDRSPTRLRAILRDLAERLKSDPTAKTREYIKQFFKQRASANDEQE